MRELLLCAGVLCAGCVTPNVYAPSAPASPAAIDALAALESIQRNLGLLRCTAIQVSGGFGAPDYSIPTMTGATGTKIGLACDKMTQLWTVPYRAYPLVSLSSDNRQTLTPFYYICARASGRECARIIYVPGDGAGARAIVDGWVALARRPVTVADPSQDTEFQASLRMSAGAAGAESQRRAQVQVEAALRNQRLIEAARIYRDALRDSPEWPAGHFNLALLYGELELFPEAITEMKRYLYLAPQARDARAAQDKVYEWEAADKL